MRNPTNKFRIQCNIYENNLYDVLLLLRTPITRKMIQKSLFFFILLISFDLFAQIEKLPESISHPVQGEGLPVISADGKTLFFTRAREGYDGSTVFDIWRSTVRADGTFKE